MLEVRDLSVSYGAVRALRSVSFDAEPGAVTAVLGANGAGKTTLLRTISGLVKPLGGSVSFDGDALVGRSVESIARMGVAHVPEGRRLFDLGLGPIALSFAGISSKEQIAHLDRLSQHDGDRWPFAWLDEQGVEYAALQ